jgi:ribosomal protein S18 acetylase RimI-like enzyme
MPVTVRPARPTELPAIAGLAAGLQVRPEHHIGYLDVEVAALERQLADLEPLGVDGVLVAFDGPAPVGLLGADWDTDPPRVWWHGPLVAADGEAAWHAAADALYAAGGALLPPEVTEEELAVDDRNVRVADFARRHGFRRMAASAVLYRDLATPLPDVEVAGIEVRRFVDADRQAVARLHDAAFAGTHVPGFRIDEGDERWVLVAHRGDAVAGYVALERQHDGQGYIDYLAVDRTERSRGIGRMLVAGACRTATDVGAERVHLTVRSANTAARRLYEQLAFVEERILVPWRRNLTAAG